MGEVYSTHKLKTGPQLELEVMVRFHNFHIRTKSLPKCFHNSHLEVPLSGGKKLNLTTDDCTYGKWKKGFICTCSKQGWREISADNWIEWENDFKDMVKEFNQLVQLSTDEKNCRFGSDENWFIPPTIPEGAHYKLS